MARSHATVTENLARYMRCLIRMSRQARPWACTWGDTATRKTPDIAGEPPRNFRRDDTKLWGRQSEPHLQGHDLGAASSLLSGLMYVSVHSSLSIGTYSKGQTQSD